MEFYGGGKQKTTPVALTSVASCSFRDITLCNILGTIHGKKKVTPGFLIPQFQRCESASGARLAVSRSQKSVCREIGTRGSFQQDRQCCASERRRHCVAKRGTAEEQQGRSHRHPVSSEPPPLT